MTRFCFIDSTFLFLRNSLQSADGLLMGLQKLVETNGETSRKTSGEAAAATDRSRSTAAATSKRETFKPNVSQFRIGNRKALRLLQ